MKEIGGYFELELNRGREYHRDAMRLNLGRAAFEYVLRARGVNKIFLPYYICDVLFEPVRLTGTDFELYHIDENLEPVFNYSSLTEADYFLYINYFGLKDKFISVLKQKVTNLIIDNSQSFFSRPLTGTDTFYSARKFFGVPDGAYLYTDKEATLNLDQDFSYDRIKHLTGRIELGAERSYKIFKKSEDILTGQPVKKMSNLTRRLLDNIDYKNTAKRRIENFNFLHGILAGINQFKFDLVSDTVPMVYPFLIQNGQALKQRLIDNKIFIATYWPNVPEKVSNDSFEFYLAKNLITLPVDQRYNNNELFDSTEIIKNQI